MKIRVVNDVTGQETIVETERPGHEVTFELMRFVRKVNRRKDSNLCCCLHASAGEVVLHWFHPGISDQLIKDPLAVGDPLREFEDLFEDGRKQMPHTCLPPATAATAAMKVCLRNQITGTETIAETNRPSEAVLADLMTIVRAVNRREDDTLRACLHVRADCITLTWFTPWTIGARCAERLMELWKPVYTTESVIAGQKRSAATHERPDVTGGGV